jgi:predicted transcriptional regulator
MKINYSVLKKMIENRLYTPGKFARLAGISPNILTSIEQGGSPRYQSLRKILAALDLTVEEAYLQNLLDD